MKHEFEKIKYRVRDIGKVRCKICNKVFTYSLRDIKSRDNLDNLICQS